MSCAQTACMVRMSVAKEIVPKVGQVVAAIALQLVSHVHTLDARVAARTRRHALENLLAAEESVRTHLTVREKRGVGVDKAGFLFVHSMTMDIGQLLRGISQNLSLCCWT